MQDEQFHTMKLPISIKECIKQFNDTSVGSTAVVVSHIHEVWEKIVGNEISQHVKVLHVNKGKLTLSVDNPAWITQLTYIHDSIIEQLNNVYLTEKIVSISSIVQA